MLILQGCATFTQQPLPNAPSLVSIADAPRARLNMSSVGGVAATYNPALVAARTRLPEEDARVFAAGLLPDPQLSLSLDDPLSNAAGLVNAYSVGLAYDLRALVLRGETIRAAEFSRLQVALDVEWQTWQTMQQARDLYIQLAFLNLKHDLLNREIGVFRKDVSHLKAVVSSGDETVDVLGASLVVLSDAENQLQNVRSQRVVIRNQLAALIGLRPEAGFSISVLPTNLGEPSDDRIEDLLASLPERRPDLLALRAGYQSQNARKRGAILGQFPSLSVGLTRARDTAALKTNGVSISLSLPLFDGNRGNIAIERATSDRLWAEYQARLDASASEVLGLKTEILILNREIAQAQNTLDEIDRIVRKGAEAYRLGDFPAQSYSALLVARLTRQLAIADLRQQVWQATNGLVSVLGGRTARQLGAPTQSRLASKADRKT
ncbi:TolC family protein [Pistricoccus aurantiacus]|nr:TolC family protein [Pistricoccus aurantiacus]